MSEITSTRASPGAAGIAYGLAAYLFWGFVPIYFKAVATVPALEILAHRVVWSVVVLGVLLAATGRFTTAIHAARHPRTGTTLVATALLVAGNWFVFIWAVGHGHILQASLGYFINPLVNVSLGFIFLGERLRRAQTLCVILAATGVLLLTVNYGEIPWIALVLAFSFGLYGLLRKKVHAGALEGLACETVFLLPVAVGFLLFRLGRGELVFGQGGVDIDILLSAAGLVTALPLWWFAKAARRLPYATVGFLQYIAPSLHFLCAVVLYREAFTTAHLVTFGFIWAALALYSADTIRVSRSRYVGAAAESKAASAGGG